MLVCKRGASGEHADFESCAAGENNAMPIAHMEELDFLHGAAAVTDAPVCEDTIDVKHDGFDAESFVMQCHGSASLSLEES